jgi:RES domain-containing protein
MLEVWRLTTARYAQSAFTGEGARLYGGRWNPKDVPVVYTSGSLSLALLELMVQDQPLRARYVSFACRVPDDIHIEQLDRTRLPDHWRTVSGMSACQAIGAEWVASRHSAVLAIPSAVIPHELNYLLNPKHQDFSRIVIGEMREIETDSRLLARGSARS